MAADARATPAQVASSGEGIAYFGNEAFPGALGNTALFAAHVSTRSTQSWETSEWTPAVALPEALKAFPVDYEFSADLSQAVLKVPVVALTPEATANAYNLFIRNSSGSYSLVNAAKPSESVEHACGPGLLWLCWQFIDVPALAGESSNLSHVVFESTAQLTPEALGESLYESFDEHVKLVGVLPDGKPAASSTAGAGSSAHYPEAGPQADRRVEHAMSSDGSRVIFQTQADGGAPVPAQAGMTEVYDRVNGSETIELSAPVVGATPAVTTAESATFWAASVDGLRVFFTSSAELTTESNTGTANGGEDLYEYDVGTRDLRDLTIDRNPEDAAGGAMVQGVVDISHDGSYVYFVAKGLLDPGKGVSGQPNLYIEHDGEAPIFIATLSSHGACEFRENQSADSCDWTPFPQELEAYVSPDGRHLAFMSTMSLPTVNAPGGYNNLVQGTSEAASVVYEYSASAAGEAEQLVCASCDRNGAPPPGNALLGGTANVERESQVGFYKYRSVNTPFYHVHAMSDSGGRLFYTMPASRSAPFERVFEYEQNGEGTCTTVGGCQYVISSGGGESDQFLDASTDGANVFFVTRNPLVTTDSDELRDVYDARVNGGMLALHEAVACESGCRPGVGSPSVQSAVSNRGGPTGNLSSSPTIAKTNGRLTRAQRLAKALKACRKIRARRSRISCERKARARYRPRVRAKKTDRWGKP